MKPEDISKELWSLANIITGFSVAQSIAVAIALGKDLADLQSQSICVKMTITVIALVVAAAYCLGVHRCRVLARSVDAQHEVIWQQVTRWRMVCIYLFTGVLIYGLFAPNIHDEVAQSPSKWQYRFIAGDAATLQPQIDKLADEGWDLATISPTSDVTHPHDAIVILRKARK